MILRALFALLVIAAVGLPQVAEAATLYQLRAKVRTDAAKSFRCPRRHVEVAEIKGSFRRTGPSDGWDFDVHACGTRFVMSATDFFGLRGYDDRVVRDRAPDDLACDADEVEVSWVSIHSRTARGCGRVARYRYTGELLDLGDWELVPEPAPR